MFSPFDLLDVESYRARYVGSWQTAASCPLSPFAARFSQGFFGVSREPNLLPESLVKVAGLDT